MTIARLKTAILHRTLVLALLVFSFLPLLGLAQSSVPDCNPWPVEDDKIAACIEYYIQNPQAKTYEPGTDPSNPATFPFAGTWGLSAAYSPKLDRVLVAASNPVSGSDYTHIMGILAAPQTLAAEGAKFQIDQARSMFRGKPKVLYNSVDDKFFAAWEDSRPSGNNVSTYARLISGAGLPEGKEIPVSIGVAYLNDIAYDPINHKYVIMHEPKHPEIKTVDASGNVDARTITVANDPNVYEGQGDIAVNTNQDEYWASYVYAKGGATPALEDEGVMFVRINAKTGEKIGDPVRVSQVHLGHNIFSSPKIEYDPVSRGGVVVWNEAGREGVMGVWGRAIADDGTLGNEFPVITTGTYPYSEGYGADSLTYNPWSGTFVLGAGDWSGNAESVEFDYGGAIYNTEVVIQPSCTKDSCGTFYIATTPTSSGQVFLASLSLGQVGGTSQRTLGGLPDPVPAPNPPAAPGKINIGSIGIAVNQIYVWSLAAAAILALLMIVVGGYITLTAAGNASRASKGKEFIFSSLIGLVLLFGSYILLRTINPDLVDFSSNQADQIQTPAK